LHCYTGYERLRFGTVLTRNDKHRKVGVYYVTGQANFARLIHLFNGIWFMIEKKTISIFSVYNNQYTHTCFSKTMSIGTQFFKCMLCGFIDAEGSFSARKNVPRVKMD
jgi:hypothetical protein